MQKYFVFLTLVFAQYDWEQQPTDLSQEEKEYRAYHEYPEETADSDNVSQSTNYNSIFVNCEKI